MKKVILFLALLTCPILAVAQKGISYQAVILDPKPIEIPGKNITGQPFVNGEVSLKFKIYSSTFVQEFEEVHVAKTDGYGLVNVLIGSVSPGAFSSVVWDSNAKNLQVWVSFDQGGSYTKVSEQVLTYNPYAIYAETAGKLSGTLGIAAGGTGATTAVAARTNLGLGNVDNTADVNKPISTATQSALATKANVDEVNTVLATKANANEVATALATKANASDVTTSLATKANASEVTTALATKANANEVSTALATKANAEEVNTLLAKKANTTEVTSALAAKANASDVTTSLATKVDKEIGKGLSSNDYTTAEKNKLAAISGDFTGNNSGVTGPAGPQGPTGPAGAQGQTGATGATGPQGVAGTDGKKVANGTTYPTSSTGVDGDFYINTATNTLFGPKTSGAWAAGVSLVGPTGATGATGAAGATGATGAAGATGSQGVAGPAPTGTGIVTVSSGTLQTPGALTGDVTTSGAGLATSIATGAVTSAKLLDGTIATADVADAAITDAKIDGVAGSKVSGNITGNAANVTGTVAVANGGTGLTSTPTDGQIDIGNGSGFTRTTLTAGTAITITNTAGAITIAAAVRPMTEQTTATSSHAVVTATFTLTNTPLNSKVWMFINGVRTNNNAYTVSGTTVTYTAANNNSYTLVVGDRIQFDYAY